MTRVRRKTLRSVAAMERRAKILRKEANSIRDQSNAIIALGVGASAVMVGTGVGIGAGALVGGLGFLAGAAIGGKGLMIGDRARSLEAAVRRATPNSHGSKALRTVKSLLAAETRGKRSGGAFLNDAAARKAETTGQTDKRAPVRRSGGGYKNGRGFANKKVQAKAQAARKRR